MRPRSTLRFDDLSGAPGDAGMKHGQVLGDLLAKDFVDAYLAALRPALRFTDDDLRLQAETWAQGLPVDIQTEIDGMAQGAGVPRSRVLALLFADIARPSNAPIDPDPTQSLTEEAAVDATPGQCSAVVASLPGPSSLPSEVTPGEMPWIARNCDWLTPTLRRGTSAVLHAAPGRLPVLAVGIRGDIDVDTGMNASGLWLHLHTLHATDPLPTDRPVISWLFWCREALETCATLDELDTFIAKTGRDRGVLVVAVESQSATAQPGASAIFACGRSSHQRFDVDPKAPSCLTNHRPDQFQERTDPAARRDGSPMRPGGSIARQRALRLQMAQSPPCEGPQDLMAMLAHPEVEMRTPRWLRTIYSVVACPAVGRIWLAAGDADGTPAASAGRWASIQVPWV